MAKPIKLKDLVDAMDMQFDASTTYYDRETGEITFVTDEEMGAAEDDEPLDDYPEWEEEAIEVARKIAADTENRFVAIPSQYDIHEYQIMEDFCHSVEDEEMSNRLLGAIKGKGAFRYFKDMIHEHGIADEWYAFRDEAFEEIAKDWCKSNGIPYIDE